MTDVLETLTTAQKLTAQIQEVAITWLNEAGDILHADEEDVDSNRYKAHLLSLYPKMAAVVGDAAVISLLRTMTLKLALLSKEQVEAVYPLARELDPKYMPETFTLHELLISFMAPLNLTEEEA